MEALVSIVIPTHNRASLLNKSIISALEQSYSNIEIIVVSDGYDDKTDSLMKSVVSTHNNVFYYTYPEAKGGNYARNFGIKHSNGDYIAFLDDDDIWYKDKIQKQMDIFSSNKDIGLVCTGVNAIYEGEKVIIKYIPPAQYDSSKMILIHNCIGSTTTVVIRRNELFQTGLFDENLCAQQDYDLWIRACQITKVGVVTEPCVDYCNYKTSNQISQCTDKYQKAVDYIEAKYSDLLSTLNDQQIKERNIQKNLDIAKKAIRNGTPKAGREYVKKAASISITKDVISCYFASFLKPSTGRKIQSFLRKLKHH